MSLLTLMPTTPVAADTPDTADTGAVDICRVIIATQHPDDKLGSCIGFQSLNFRDNYIGLVPHLCEYVETHSPDVFDSTYDSYSDCVTDGASAFF